MLLFVDITRRALLFRAAIRVCCYAHRYDAAADIDAAALCHVVLAIFRRCHDAALSLYAAFFDATAC